MESKNRKLLACDWFEIADSDLAYARLGIEKGDFYAQISFHAQQAAEKYLKGFLVLNDKKFRKTHDLVELIGLCQKIKASFKNLRKFADILAPYAVDIRYPVHYPIVRKEHAEEAIAAAEEIIEFVKEKIK